MGAFSALADEWATNSSVAERASNVALEIAGGHQNKKMAQSVAICMISNLGRACFGGTLDIRAAAAAGLTREGRTLAKAISEKHPVPEDFSGASKLSSSVGAFVPLNQDGADMRLQLVELRRPCVVCGALTTRRCSRCMGVYFCGDHCMAVGWPVHRGGCQRSVAYHLS